MKKWNVGAVALLVAVVWGTAGFAWQAEPRTPPKQDETTRTTTQSMTLDRPLVEFFASKLVLCNNAAIQCSQLAAGKASNNEVKQFAETMAKEHAKFNEQLKAFNASYGVEPITETAPTAKKTTAQGAAKADTERAAEQAAAKEPPAAKDPAVAQQPAIKTQTETSFRVGDKATLQRVFEVCKAASDNASAAGKEMISKKSGAEFDKAYMGGQVMGHVMALAELKALESRATDEFQSVIREARANIEGHLQKAESICKSLENTKETSAPTK